MALLNGIERANLEKGVMKAELLKLSQVQLRVVALSAVQRKEDIGS